MDFLIIVVMLCGNINSYGLYDSKLNLYYYDIKPEQIMKVIEGKEETTKRITVTPDLEIVCA